MNYIKHLTGFFDRVVRDDNLNPTHISLYISLFQFWNMNRFQNPISIARNEMMRISKISAKATYHKCMKELHQHGYLRYEPSFNPFRGSLVYLINFSDDLNPVPKKLRKNNNKNQSSAEPPLNILQTGVEQAVVPSVNSTNIVNKQNVTNSVEQSQSLEMKMLQPVAKKKVAPKKKVVEKSITFIPPEPDEVETYFISQQYSLLEAQKFHNHFQSNGWLVGGKSPMKDWKAAARNWMLNANKFAGNQSEVKHLSTLQNKNYAEPL